MAHRIQIDAAGMRISKRGQDCLSGVASDLLIDTTTRRTRAFMAGTVTGANQGNGYTVAVAHGLGYIPLCSAFCPGNASIVVKVDSGNLYITFYTAYAAYVIFYDRWV